MYTEGFDSSVSRRAGSSRSNDASLPPWPKDLHICLILQESAFPFIPQVGPLLVLLLKNGVGGGEVLHSMKKPYPVVRN